MNTYCEQNKKQFYIYYYIKKVIFNLFRINLYQTTVLSNIRGIKAESGYKARSACILKRKRSMLIR